MKQRFHNFIIIYFLITYFSIICNGKVPKEYQIDKSKWQNPSDHYTKVTPDDLKILVETEEENVCTKNDGINCDSDLNEWRQNEWLFAWGTIVFAFVTAFFTVFTCLFFLCHKPKPFVPQKMASEEEADEKMEPNNFENIPIQTTETTETSEDSVTSEVVETTIDKNTVPKIEFDNEFLLFGPIESESEADGNRSHFETSMIEESIPSSSDLILEDSSKTESEPVKSSNIKIAEKKPGEDYNNLLIKNEITPLFVNPSHLDSRRTSTDEDDDFYVIGKKEE